MARKTNTDPFDFRNARGSSGRTAFRTPMTGGVDPLTLRRSARYQNALRNVDSQGRPMLAQASVNSPWKVLAMMASRMVRAGVRNSGDFLNMMDAAVIAKRGKIPTKIGQSMVRGSIEEASALYSGKPSTMFTRGFSASPEQASEYYRAIAKILGRVSSTFPANQQNIVRGTAAFLKNEARKGLK